MERYVRSQAGGSPGKPGGGWKRAARYGHLFPFFLLLLPGIALPQESAPTDGGQGGDYRIQVRVESVVLRATVQDNKGTLVSGLKKEDFHVTEDGVPQQITNFSHDDVPVTVGLVVDNSGSMQPKRADVIAAALAFTRSSNPQDQMFVVMFNEHVYLGLPDDMPFTDSIPDLEKALARLAARGETALYDAVAVGLDHLKMANRDKKVLIVITDGGDNASKHKLDDVRKMAAESNAIVYTIGIYDEYDPDQRPHVLKQLAKDTGGEAYMPDSLQEVAPICQRIAHDIRSQFTLVYTPTNTKQDGSYRSIQVKAAAHGRGRLNVRTRTGYYAPVNSAPVPASANSRQ